MNAGVSNASLTEHGIHQYRASSVHKNATTDGAGVQVYFFRHDVKHAVTAYCVPSRHTLRADDSCCEDGQCDIINTLSKLIASLSLDPL